MIIVLKQGTTQQEIDTVTNAVVARGVSVTRSLPKPRRPRRTKSFPMCGAALAAPLFSSLGQIWSA